jgi:hypothetical protein
MTEKLDGMQKEVKKEEWDEMFWVIMQMGWEDRPLPQTQNSG